MAKPAITKRTTKAAALTYAELDTNFQNLQDATLTVKAGTGGTNVVADLNGTITLVAGTGVTLTGDNTAKTVTIDAAGGGASLDVNDIQVGNSGNSSTVTISTDVLGKSLKLQGGLSDFSTSAGVSISLLGSYGEGGSLMVIDNFSGLQINSGNSFGVTTTAPNGNGTTYYLRGGIQIPGQPPQYFSIKLEPNNP
jgi:hypothetical protein